MLSTRVPGGLGDHSDADDTQVNIIITITIIIITDDDKSVPQSCTCFYNLFDGDLPGPCNCSLGLQLAK